MSEKVLLIGTGQISLDYYKALVDMGVDTNVVGRGESSAKVFFDNTGLKPITGGIKNYFRKESGRYNYAIVSVQIVNLYEVCVELINSGIQNILVEKPAGLNKIQIESLSNLAKASNSNVFVAYNRRFYSSVIKAQEIIREDGGISSIDFEFTEWSNEIEKLNYPKIVKNNWFLANSSHVVDLSFYLAGNPVKIESFVTGGLDWHPDGSVFSGAGMTNKNVVFSYKANWESAGRWSIDIRTKFRKLLLCPLEKLQIQKKDSLKLDFCKRIDYGFDDKYKPGFYLQVKEFLGMQGPRLKTIDEQLVSTSFYDKICNN